MGCTPVCSLRYYCFVGAYFPKAILSSYLFKTMRLTQSSMRCSEFKAKCRTPLRVVLCTKIDKRYRISQ
ncbi:hypothetical protein PGF_00013170 [Porphyromonas gingivalis 381]|nr:hypothetical protein PGF_00013170 [Porphyromonas gingivalis 381]